MKTAIRSLLCGVAAAAFVAGCAKSGGGISNGNEPISAFPIFTPSTVVAANKYDDSDEITKLGSNFFGTGDDAYKPFIGVQELIKTSATLDDLDAWLRQTVQSPPPDLTPSQNTIAHVLATPASEESPATAGSASPVPSGDAPASDPTDSAAPAATGTAASTAATPGATSTSTAGAATPATGSPAPGASGIPAAPGVEDPFAEYFKPFGLVPAAFWTQDRGRVVMIIIMDPKAVADHLGPTLGMLDQYDKLPSFLRGGIDDAVKKQTGFSVSDLMNTNTPMGMIVYAARNMRTEDSRAIILVDAQRQPNPLPTPQASGT